MEIEISFRELNRGQKAQVYASCMKPMINDKALFADGSLSYRIPHEPTAEDDIRVRIRTERENVEKVTLIYKNNDRISREIAKKVKSDTLFDYYEAVIPKSNVATEYYFKLQAGQAVCYYNQRGVVDEPQEYYNFRITPGYKTPDWAKGAVMYQIYVDRFCNGDSSNDVENREYFYIGNYAQKVENWGKYPESMDVRAFYGGDLMGVKEKLDYLQELGIEVLYFNPIFVSPSNHKYDIQDYDYIDPHYGVIVKEEGECLPDWEKDNSKATKYISRVTSKENLEASNQFFVELVEEIHKRGMKVILDGVFNHCGSFNKWLDRERIYEAQTDYVQGAYVDPQSPYRSFFQFSNEKSWPYNASYDGWWGHDTLPKLNYEGSPKLYQYILDIAKKWVSPPYNVDGWRLDVAADLAYSSEVNHQFWRDFRKVVKEANPEAIILAEHYGDAESWLRGDQWDTIMNYDAFMEPITWFFTGMEKHSDEYREDLKNNYESFQGAMSHHMSRFHRQSLEVSMNELSNHDHSRFLTRTNGKVGRIQSVGAEAANEGIHKGIFREAVVMQMTWPGAPTVYYGDEAGVCGWTDPDNRRTYPWGCEDLSLIQFHKDMIRIHKESKALKRGSLKLLYGAYGIITYGRFLDDEKYIIALNNQLETREIEIPVWQIGILDGEQLVRLIGTTEKGHSLEPISYFAYKGKIKIRMEATSAVVFKACSDLELLHERKIL